MTSWGVINGVRYHNIGKMRRYRFVSYNEEYKLCKNLCLTKYFYDGIRPRPSRKFLRETWWPHISDLTQRRVIESQVCENLQCILDDPYIGIHNHLRDIPGKLCFVCSQPSTPGADFCSIECQEDHRQALWFDKWFRDKCPGCGLLRLREPDDFNPYWGLKFHGYYCPSCRLIDEKYDGNKVLMKFNRQLKIFKHDINKKLKEIVR